MKPNKKTAAKPSWKDAPDEARYLGQDSDGTWRWFMRKPRLLKDFDRWASEYGEWEEARTPNPKWRSTLEKRPKYPKAWA